MRIVFIMLLSTLLGLSSAFAAGRSWGDLVSLTTSAKLCNIDLNPTTAKWTESMLDLIDDAQRDQFVERVEGDFSSLKSQSSQAVIDYCWTVHETLNASGWL